MFAADEAGTKQSNSDHFVISAMARNASR
jgi:hypothetical protein